MQLSKELVFVEAPLEHITHDVSDTPAVEDQDDALATPLRYACCVVGTQ